LKEGLTVFRDQQFTSDMRSRAVKRIDDVLLLRAAQFPEDSGPLAHSVRPEKFIEIDNFFTSTVYEKGAELCRMIDTLVGRDGFRKGIDLYFERHDGTAATVEQFVDAMADANGCDLTHFLKWYSQAGTPEVSAHVDYDPASRTATLDLKQETQPTPDKSPKEPFFIPLKLGLLDSDGQDVPLNLEGEKDGAGETTRVLAFDSAKKTFRFEDIDGPVTPSLFREFSAPVKVVVDLSDQQRALLMSKDSDPFNRWEAGFQFGLSILLELTSGIFEGKDYQIPQSYLDALTSTLTDPSLDNHLKALVLTCPSEKAIAQASQVIQVEAIHQAHQQMREAICDHAGSVLNETYHQCMSNEPYSPDAKSAGRRALKNTALSLLNAGNSSSSLDLAQSQFANADNMTDTMGALSVLNNKVGPERDVAFSQFYERWSKDSMVIDKWFSLQAQSSLPNTFERVQELMNDTAFSKTNPNKIHALVGAFARRNQLRFHRPDGAAYSFLADLILEIDSFNPEMAAGIMEVFANWRKYESKQKRLMHEQISRIATSTSLSPNLFEITTKTLA
jgi:aminopeptidase N